MRTWLDLFPLLRLPTLGNLVQPISPVTSWFSPTIEVNYKGDPAIEHDVVTSVAGYGSQLGTLIDAVVEGAGGKGGPAMKQLVALKRAIDAVKDQHRDDDASRARSALAALAQSDPVALQRLVAEYASTAR
jgi:hypothetical protein